MTLEIKDILIAEDDKDDVALLTEALQIIFPDSNIVGVPDGIAAIRYIKTSSPPDLVFLDLNMPLKNGLSCLRDIYNLELLTGTPIIIYSTSHNIKDIDEAYKHNAAFYIIKPASFKHLCEIIRAAIGLLQNPSFERVEKQNFVLSETKLDMQDTSTSF
jgi:CheY-like chemotaxis protein